MKTLLLFILLSLLTSAHILSAGIDKIIPQIKLIQGQEKKIVLSDLFYLPDYDIKFENTIGIQTDYNAETNILKLYSKNKTGYSLLKFNYDNVQYAIPLLITESNYMRFTFKAERGSEIYLFGNFNNWNRTEYKLNYNEEQEIFEITIPLDYGSYEYKFMANGKEVIDPANPDKLPNGLGGENSTIRLLKPSGSLYLHILDYMESSEFITMNFYSDLNDVQLDKKESKVYAILNNQHVDDYSIAINGNFITVDIPIEHVDNDDMLRVTVANGTVISNTQIIPLGQLSRDKDFSWYDGIIYSIMIDRFADGDPQNSVPVVHDSILTKANYMGGDLNGITGKISDGYFDSLGVNVLWISPVYDNPDEAYKEYPAPHRWYSGYHGYWPISATKVEPRFGGMMDLKNLISTAHNHDIKVLLDFVSNHVHEQHPYYINHPEWFGSLTLPDGRLNLRYWDEYRLTTWFEPYLPSFDYVSSDEALNTMVENAVWWLEETGADGFRHDAVKHVPNKFWRSLTREINESVNRTRELNVYQIGETFGDYGLVSSYVNNGQLDAQFNFNLYNTAHAVFIDSSRSFQLLNDEMKKTFSVYGVLNKMGNIMDSHDKNRFMAYADGDLKLDSPDAVEIGWYNPPFVDNPESYKLAELYYAYMFTIPGLPVIYYGSEFGMTGASDPDNRRMMRFEEKLSSDEKEMLNNVRLISQLRNKHNALRYGDFYSITADKKIFAFIRSNLTERILVVLNKSGEKVDSTFTLPDFYNLTEGTDLVSFNNYSISNDKINLTIPARGWKLVKLD